MLQDKCGLLRTPLQKIITGGVLVAVSFVVSALVEMRIQRDSPHPPGKDQAR